MTDIFDYLRARPYPGRGILLGAAPDGAPVCAYFIMGRSENSRNRVFERTPDGIRTRAFDEAKMTDPSLIIYHPVRRTERGLIVTNGDQTDTIRDGHGFVSALRTRRFEPDAPNWTPRISGLLTPDGSYKLSILRAADEAGAQLLYTLVPEQRTVFAEYYPDWMDNPGQQTKRSRQALFAALERAEIPALDLTPVFAQQSDLLSCYSRVDHHYTLKGAYVTYQSVCEAFGIRASGISIAETQSDLLGTYNRKLYDLSPVREAMQVVQTPFPEYERLDNGAASDTPLIRIRGSGQSLYGDYMGGDIAETIVRTNRPALPRILIVGDSFTNALELLAVFDFDEMRSLDYRHFDGPVLSDYIRAYRPDYVLILRDDVSCLGSDGNGALQ